MPLFNGAFCETHFFSSLFALGVISGQAEVDLDGGANDESVDLGRSKVTGLYARGNELYVFRERRIGNRGEPQRLR